MFGDDGSSASSEDEQAARASALRAQLFGGDDDEESKYAAFGGAAKPQSPQRSAATENPTPLVSSAPVTIAVDSESEDASVQTGEGATDTDDEDIDVKAQRIIAELDDELQYVTDSRRYWCAAGGIVCFTCGKRGHARDECTEASPCFFCGLRTHQANDCVTGVCFRCYRIGHERQHCNRSDRTRLICDSCGMFGHANTECPTIWRDFVPSKKCAVKKAVIAWCYNCAGRGHFGDDCPSTKQYRGISLPASSFSRSKNDLKARDTSATSSKRKNYHRSRSPRRDRYRQRSPSPAQYQPPRGHNHGGGYSRPRHHHNDMGDRHRYDFPRHESNSYKPLDANFVPHIPPQFHANSSYHPSQSQSQYRVIDLDIDGELLDAKSIKDAVMKKLSLPGWIYDRIAVDVDDYTFSTTIHADCRRFTTSDLTAANPDKWIDHGAVKVDRETQIALAQSDFNMWPYDNRTLVVFVSFFYNQLNIIDNMEISPQRFETFLMLVLHSYNPNPFHNFRHAFTVTQMAYAMVNELSLVESLGMENLFVLLTACLCHDLDHPAFNNTFQVNARTELATLYNDQSPLENHHCSVAFRIIQQSKLLEHLDCFAYKNIRRKLIACILATDISQQKSILQQLPAKESFDMQNDIHREKLLVLLVKASDLGAEVRPIEVSEPWVDLLFQEFTLQGNLEDIFGLPRGVSIDQRKPSKKDAQLGFIEHVLLPVYRALEQFLPRVGKCIKLLLILCDIKVYIEKIEKALSYYRSLAEM